MTAAPTPDTQRSSTDPRLLATIVAVAAGAAAAALHHVTGMFWGDLGAYRAGAVAAGAGELYQAVHHTPDGTALGFTYPPFAALLLRPFAVAGHLHIVAGIKLTPLIFVGYLVLTGRWRAAGIAVAAFAATIGLGFAWRPADSARFWSGGLLDTTRVTGDPRTILNQSLSGAVTRIADDPQPGLAWLIVAALAGAAGMAVAVAYHRAGDELAAVLACAATGLLISPVSWHHHWVWWVPALLLLARHAREHRDRGATITAMVVWVTLVASTSWVLASPGGWDLRFTGLGLVYSNLYVLLALTGLGAAAWRLYRDRSAAADDRRYAVARVHS
ncbi:glycosyltransferase 87 family protein [Micromonospora sp. LOL_023]|uniref:glycosyltransferase 87 family protein n=1 Tax=Micromonospora sp. LOL_023 TaxID=3345418 RepID=UPI003A8A3CE0